MISFLVSSSEVIGIRICTSGYIRTFLFTPWMQALTGSLQLSRLPHGVAWVFPTWRPQWRILFCRMYPMETTSTQTPGLLTWTTWCPSLSCSWSCVYCCWYYATWDIGWDSAGCFRENCKIGRAHVWTPVTSAHLVCRLLLEKKKTKHQTLPHNSSPVFFF